MIKVLLLLVMVFPSFSWAKSEICASLYKQYNLGELAKNPKLNMSDWTKSYFPNGVNYINPIDNYLEALINKPELYSDEEFIVEALSGLVIYYDNENRKHEILLVDILKKNEGAVFFRSKITGSIPIVLAIRMSREEVLSVVLKNISLSYDKYEDLLFFALCE